MSRDDDRKFRVQQRPRGRVQGCHGHGSEAIHAGQSLAGWAEEPISTRRGDAVTSEEDLALGLDIGGTSTRALAVDSAGRRCGYGAAGGGNPVSHPPQEAVSALSTAVRLALRDVDPRRVRTAVVGLAGGSSLAADPRVSALFEAAWRGVGLRCPLERVGDVEVAFAAGAVEPDGTILVAGTGAVVARVRDRVRVESVDGHGWLLGDLGSGFWLGRQAVRAALASLDARRASTLLTGLVARELLGRDVEAGTGRQEAEALIAAVHARPPVALARLAPLVGRAADAGDEVARGVVRAAVEHLVAAVTAVRDPTEATPLVVAGGVTDPGTAVGRALWSRLDALWPGMPRAAADGVAGAAWLALLRRGDIDGEAAAALHRRLVPRPLPPSHGETRGRT